MKDKNDPGEEYRTFETRLNFIADTFTKPYTKEEIMTSCIQFKLNKSYEQYLEEVNRSLHYLASQDADKIINKL